MENEQESTDLTNQTPEEQGKAMGDALFGPEKGSEDSLSPEGEVDRDAAHPDAEKQKNDDGSAPTDTEGKEAQTEKSKEGEAEKLTDEQVAAKEAVELKGRQDAEEAELMGIEQSEELTDPAVVATRLAEKDRYINEMQTARQDQEQQLSELLSSVGRKLITTASGQLQLTVSDEAKDFAAEDIDAGKLWNNLSSDKQALFGEEDGKKAFTVAAQEIGKEFASQIPPITAQPQEAVLTGQQRDEVYTDFVLGKKTDGKTAMYPDTEKPEIRDRMTKILNGQKDPVFNELKKAAAKNELLQHSLLQLAWLKVFRARQGALALAAGTKRQQETKTQQNKQKVAVSGSGGGVGATGKDGAGAKTLAEKVADEMETGDRPLRF